MTKCDDVRLEEYHDGELAGPAADEVHAHVAGCAACAKALQELARLEEVLRSAPAGDRPETDRYLADVKARLRVAHRGRWRTIVPLAAAAALFAAFFWFIPAIRTAPAPDVTALVDEYATSAEKHGIEKRIYGAGDDAVATLKRLVRDSSSPLRQQSAGILLAKHPNSELQAWLLESQQRAQAGEPEWELTEIGSEPTDVELIGCAFELLRSSRTRADAAIILRKLDKSGANRAAHDEIVDRVKGMLASPSGPEQELGLEAVRILEIRFLLPDLVDLLDAPVLGDKAHRFLKEQTQKDFGRDKEAWRRWFGRKL